MLASCGLCNWAFRTSICLQQATINMEDGVMIGIEVVVPNFGGMIQDLKRGTFHLSTNWVGIPEV
jgi:hypothetical protein